MLLIKIKELIAGMEMLWEVAFMLIPVWLNQNCPMGNFSSKRLINQVNKRHKIMLL